MGGKEENSLLGRSSLGSLVLGLGGDLGGSLYCLLLGTKDVAVDLVDDRLDLLSDVRGKLLRLFLDGAVLGEDNILDVGGDLAETLDELLGNVLALVSEGAELGEKVLSALLGLVDGLGGASLERAELRVDGGSLVEDLLDDWLDEGNDTVVGECLGLLDADELVGGGLEGIREGCLGAVKGGYGDTIGRLEDGLGACEDGGGGLVGAGGNAKGSLVEVGSELSRLDKGAGC